MARSLGKRMLSIFVVLAVMFSSAIFCNNFLKTSAQTTATNILYQNDNVKKPSEAGALQVKHEDGNAYLADSNGNVIQLRGMSTHGLQWYPEILNNNAFQCLSYEWGCNVIRLAMYVGEDGYATDPTLKDKVIEGINLAKANDMYAIVDFHVLTPGDPNDEIYSGASDFFKEISETFPNDPNVIYELCNEPNTDISNDADGWQSVKNYAEPLVQMLRDSGNENLILVGSPNWSQRPDLAADDPIEDDNIAYTFHFYAGTHATSEVSTDRDNVMSNVRYALENDVCVFASEFGTSEADGTGGNYFSECNDWITFLNENNISWCNWALSNKNEDCAAFLPYIAGQSNATSLDPGDDYLWYDWELTDDGVYIEDRIQGISYQAVDRHIGYFIRTPFDFNDGTTQGFGLNADSPVKDVTCTNENNTLKLSGLPLKTSATGNNFWEYTRISADSASADSKVNIKGALDIVMNIIVDEPCTVEVTAVPQSDEFGWESPSDVQLVCSGDFVPTTDSKYVARLVLDEEEAPNLKNIAESETDNILTNLILFVGSDSSDVAIDNIEFIGTTELSETETVDNDDLGTPTLPATFEDLTRDGFAFDSSSGVQNSLNIMEANGSNALSFECTYPDEKPTDGWASAARLIQSNINTTRGDNDELSFDLYLDPTTATTGNINVFLAFCPPDLGYWAQCADAYTISLDSLSTAEVTSDGLYHYVVTFDLTNLSDSKVLEADTLIRDITIVLADDESDFSGRMYIDNVALINSADVVSDDVVSDSEGTDAESTADESEDEDTTSTETSTTDTTTADETTVDESTEDSPKTADETNIPIACASVMITLGLGYVISKKLQKSRKSGL